MIAPAPRAPCAVAGTAIYVALNRLALTEPDSTMVVLVCDAGEKYLDTVFDDDWLMERQLLSEATHQRVNGVFEAYLESIRLAAVTPPRLEA